MANKNLHNAKESKNDEFYTQLEDIEKELSHYRHHFEGKVVFCNCDDPYESNFFKYFVLNFNTLKLKKLIATSYIASPVAFKELPAKKGNSSFDGDFRSSESKELLKQADIVVTNPPFSLFREYVAQLIEFDKKFIILGNMNAITYKEVFPLIKNNKIWAGYGFNQSMVFTSPYGNDLESNRKFCESKGYFGNNYIKVPAINWYTNLDIKKRHEELILVKKYNPLDHPKYDNYDAIEVSKVKDIPKDYDGAMGVPITFFDKFNPEQFELFGATESEGKGFSNGLWNEESKVAQPLVNGKKAYKRLFIKNKKVER